MKIIPSGTSESCSSIDSSIDPADIALNELTGEIPGLNVMLEYDVAMLAYDHEITEAMNFIANLWFHFDSEKNIVS